VCSCEFYQSTDMEVKKSWLPTADEFAEIVNDSDSAIGVIPESGSSASSWEDSGDFSELLNDLCQSGFSVLSTLYHQFCSVIHSPRQL
jgi:hypothetical protein